MKSILIGNGINIQYGGYENTSESIINRAIEQSKKDDYPKHVIIDEPDSILMLLSSLYDEVLLILSDKNYNYAYTTDEKKSLLDFKKRYSKRGKLKLIDIGFEDYLLVYDLFCYRNRIVNPDKFDFRERLKRFFIYSIYNKGRVEKIKNNFPNKLCEYLNSFDNIFTTNYDSNLDVSCKPKVLHLHGSFSVKSIVYNSNSFRNQLSDSPINNYSVDDNYFYLYSNIITDFNGFSKDFTITQHEKTNSMIEKFAEACKTNKNIRKSIKSWSKDSNLITRNLGESIMMKVKNPELQYDEYYPIKDFRAIDGIIEVIGLSPNNDTHIFDEINQNISLNKIVYFYYENKEIDDVKTLLKSKKLEFRDIKLLWSEMSTNLA